MIIKSVKLAARGTTKLRYVCTGCARECDQPAV